MSDVTVIEHSPDEWATLRAERDRLQHRIDCADTPLMRDVMRERDEARQQLERAVSRLEALKARLRQEVDAHRMTLHPRALLFTDEGVAGLPGRDSRVWRVSAARRANLMRWQSSTLAPAKSTFSGRPLKPSNSGANGGSAGRSSAIAPAATVRSPSFGCSARTWSWNSWRFCPGCVAHGAHRTWRRAALAVTLARRGAGGAAGPGWSGTSCRASGWLWLRMVRPVRSLASCSVASASCCRTSANLLTTSIGSRYCLTMPDQSISISLPSIVIDALIARAGIECKGGKFVLPTEAQPLFGHVFTWAKDEAATWAAIIVATADLGALAI